VTGEHPDHRAKWRIPGTPDGAYRSDARLVYCR